MREAPSTKQAAALLLSLVFRCLLYGGAAGGGKSSLGLMACLQGARRPGASLILRRESVNLTQPGALIPRSHEWLTGTDAHWRGDEKTWYFPSGFALKFGHMEHEADKHNYQSAEYDTIFFEELTEFSESQFRFQFSRQRRRAGSQNPLRMLGATNPGGIGHEWVSSCWGLGDHEGKPSEPSWKFLSALLEDNPGIDAASYIESLSHLTEFVRRQLQHGDWKARPKGDLFKVDRIRFCNLDEVPRGGGDTRFWDLAATEAAPGKDPDATAGARGTVVGNVLYVVDLQHFRAGPGGVQTRVRSTAEADGRGTRVILEQEPGAAGKTVVEDYKAQVLPGWAVEGRPASGAKRSRWLGFEAAVEQERVVFVRGEWNRKALNEIGALTTDEAQDEKNGLHDDVVDACAGLYNALQSAVAPKAWRPTREPAKPLPVLKVPPLVLPWEKR